MALTKTKLSKGQANGPAGITPTTNVAESAEVLTLEEAANYLRVSEPDVLTMVDKQGLPGRNIGKQWRFLKSALRDWLRAPLCRPSKQALLAVVGSWKDDPDLERMLEEIYQRRGRPMIGEGK